MHCPACGGDLYIDDVITCVDCNREFDFDDDLSDGTLEFDGFDEYNPYEDGWEPA